MEIFILSFKSKIVTKNDFNNVHRFSGAIFFCMYLFLFMLLGLPASAKDFAAWPNDLEAALARGKKENKMVFVHFYTPHCPFCTKMQRQTFKDTEVQKQLENTILVAVNVAQNRRIGQLYQIRGVPDTRLYQSDGKNMLMHVRGFMQPRDMAQELKKIMTFYERINVSLKKYAQNKNSELALEIAHSYYLLENYTEAIRFFEASPLIKQDWAEDSAKHKEFGFALMAVANYAEASKQFKKFIKFNGENTGDKHWYVRLLLAFTEMNLGKHREALGHIDQILAHSKAESIRKEATSLRAQINQMQK